jgi:erythromycin esterase
MFEPYASPLATIEPDEPFDDLEPLREVIGDARVVAIGENNHHIAEFYRLRHRLVRFLVTRCGFTVLGFESGFPEGLVVDDWLRGGDGADGGDARLAEVADESVTFGLGRTRYLRELLRWMRDSAAAGTPVRFAGLDVPASGGSPLPALEPVAAFLREVDPGAASLADQAIAAASRYASASSALTLRSYAELAQTGRDAATAALSRLIAHVEALRVTYLPRAGTQRYELVTRLLLSAWRLDHYVREVDTMTSGVPRYGENSSRDVHMAQTVQWLLAHGGGAPGGGPVKIIAAVHNGHLQRVPMAFGETTPILPMGQHLAADLGGDYVPIALTCAGGVTTGLSMDPLDPLGFTLHRVPLADPAPGSIEAALVADGLVTDGPVTDGLVAGGHAGTVVDLRPLRGAEPGSVPGMLRHADTYVGISLPDAYDAVICLPSVSPTEYVPHDG